VAMVERLLHHTPTPDQPFPVPERFLEAGTS
jgi:hypothetical protein